MRTIMAIVLALIFSACDPITPEEQKVWEIELLEKNHPFWTDERTGLCFMGSRVLTEVGVYMTYTHIPCENLP